MYHIKKPVKFATPPPRDSAGNPFENVFPGKSQTIFVDITKPKRLLTLKFIKNQ